MLKRGPASFLAGFVTAAILFGGVAVGATAFQKSITVTDLPLRYLFDGAERIPPRNEQGFIYEARTYVPLRFVAEALGKKVDFDAKTNTVLVGGRPAALPSFWSDRTYQGGGSYKLSYFDEGIQTVRGTEMSNAVIISLATAPPADPRDDISIGQMWVDVDLEPGAKSLSGTLFVPIQYFGMEGERRVGRLTVLDELNRAIYTGPELTTASESMAFEVPLTGVKRVRVAVTLYPHQGVQVSDALMMAHLGIADLQVK